MEMGAATNTDKELWREHNDDFYSDSIHVTKDGGIGINVGGKVIVKTLKEWHALALETTNDKPESSSQQYQLPDKYVDEVERGIAKDFPEYQKFFTGKPELRQGVIVNSIGRQKIDTVEEMKVGGLGDMLDVYTTLTVEARHERTLAGKFICTFLRPFTFNFKRMSYDRNYLLTKLRKALNTIKLKW